MHIDAYVVPFSRWVTYLDFFPHFQRIFFKIIFSLKTISDKNCETCTPSPLPQCWLQVCLLIPGLQSWDDFFRFGTTLSQGELGILGIFKQVKYHFVEFLHENIMSLNYFVTDCSFSKRSLSFTFNLTEPAKKIINFIWSYCTSYTEK